MAVGYAVYCSGDTSGAKGKFGDHEVGIAIKESILEETGETYVAVNCISDRLMNVRRELKGESTELLL